MSRRVLVVGAQPHSLGDQIGGALIADGWELRTAGVSGEEDIRLDLAADEDDRLRDVLAGLEPQHVVCTAGINYPQTDTSESLTEWYGTHWWANVMGPMRLLREWQKFLAFEEDIPGLHHYVAISSNSARIPRGASAAYCASKAALSMALRVEARNADGGDYGYIVYGYEPGLLAGTPMTNGTAAQFPGVPLHRMRGSANAEGVSAGELAALVVHNLGSSGAALNGCLIPFDAGEI